MATIRAFSAILPSRLPLELQVLKARLEPHGGLAGLPSLSDCRGFLDSLIASENYVVEDPAIYIYGYEPAWGETRLGVWAASSLADAVWGKILAHEETLTGLADRIGCYREQVGLEGSAVVLGYVGNAEIDRLVDMARRDTLERRFVYGEAVHRVWKVSHPYQVEGLIRAFAGLARVYVADGHHRLAAARAMHGGSPQWISSLYMDFGQLEIAAFHRLVRMEGVDRGALVRGIAAYYQLNFIPSNQPYRPVAKGYMGLFLSGIWYELAPREGAAELFDLPEVKLLQERILAPVLGIVDPAGDPRLECYNNGPAWEQLLLEIKKDPSVIVFTLFPMSASELMDMADMGLFLPPKSTFIAPKAPFGILMRDMKTENMEGTGK